MIKQLNRFMNFDAFEFFKDKTLIAKSARYDDGNREEGDAREPKLKITAIITEDNTQYGDEIGINLFEEVHLRIAGQGIKKLKVEKGTSINVLEIGENFSCFTWRPNENSAVKFFVGFDLKTSKNANLPRL